MGNDKGKGGFANHPEYINRKGRPPKGAALTDVLRERVGKEEMADKLIKMARDGDIAALKYIYDRLDGKPKETVEQTTVNIANPLADELRAIREGLNADQRETD